ncbi:hypothetical protein CDG79_26885 [Nostoc sp. 'Peltigera membranacea cyanobiont' 232]|nr:hypothetical protein CDG79_26885 [Nostoc sp. 'Peltigera membranacea cyanobiont' 232]
MQPTDPRLLKEVGDLVRLIKDCYKYLNINNTASLLPMFQKFYLESIILYKKSWHWLEILTGLNKFRQKASIPEI